MNDLTFLYFAYGSNMLWERLRRRTPSAQPAEKGWIENYRLSFRKRSIDGSGKCDVVPTSDGKIVHGVIYRINTNEHPALDIAEGYKKGYERSTIHVATKDGKGANCVYYYATDYGEELKPYDWYKALVIAGFEQNDLPSNEVTTLDAISDPNPKRKTRVEALEALKEYESTKRK